MISDMVRTPALPKVAKLCAAFLLLSSTLSLHAQSQFEEEFDDKEKPWEEIAIQLPAPPAEENLLPFYVGPIATQSFAIDAKSLTVGTDGVIRYTLVAKSPGGAINVSYEGIRCQSYEKKLYAFGHIDGKWSRSRRDQWEPIFNKIANRQHAALAEDYFCQATTVAGTAKDMLERLRLKRPLTRGG
jgi:hypothetical protein